MEEFLSTGEATAAQLNQVAAIFNLQSPTSDFLSALHAALFAPWEALGEVEFPQPEGVTVERFGHQGNGCGWLLTLVEAAAAEYGQNPMDVMHWPLETLFVLNTASRLRNGAQWKGPSYEDVDRLETEEPVGAPFQARPEENHHAI